MHRNLSCLSILSPSLLTGVLQRERLSNWVQRLALQILRDTAPRTLRFNRMARRDLRRDLQNSMMETAQKDMTAFKLSLNSMSSSRMKHRRLLCSEKASLMMESVELSRSGAPRHLPVRLLLVRLWRCHSHKLVLLESAECKPELPWT
jgi:hypothetical protein